MVTIYFAYGLVFFGTGLLLAFQARLPVSLLSRRQLGCLAMFASLRGLFEWAKMEELASSSSFIWAPLQLALLAASFALLMQFGFEVLSDLGRVPSWTRMVPAALFLFTLLAALTIDGGTPQSTEAVARYAFGLPGALLAAFALLAFDRDRRRAGLVRKVPYVSLAAGMFVVFSLAGGLVVPPASFFPASWLNTETFRAATGVDIEVVRAICAVIVAVLVTEAFIIESAKEHAEWERRREEFLSVVAHDLRSPIGAINLGASAIERFIEHGERLDHDRVLRLIRNMKSSAGNLDRMVSDLLDTSRIEARRLKIEAISLEPCALVRSVVARASVATKDRPINLLVPESLPNVMADPARIEQILINLLSNAAKYSTAGSEIQVAAVGRDTEIEVAVTNTGEGLAPEESAKLFTRFYRSRADDGRVSGMGLGLYIVKGLVEAHGGRIWVDSKPGKYATFAFTIPIAAPR